MMCKQLELDLPPAFIIPVDCFKDTTATIKMIGTGGLFSSVLRTYENSVFLELRNILARENLIKMNTQSFNADVVIRDFYLNDFLCKQNERFYCGAYWYTFFKARDTKRIT